MDTALTSQQEALLERAHREYAMPATHDAPVVAYLTDTYGNELWEHISADNERLWSFVASEAYHQVANPNPTVPEIPSPSPTSSPSSAPSAQHAAPQQPAPYRFLTTDEIESRGRVVISRSMAKDASLYAYAKERGNNQSPEVVSDEDYARMTHQPAPPPQTPVLSGSGVWRHTADGALVCVISKGLLQKDIRQYEQLKELAQQRNATVMFEE